MNIILKTILKRPGWVIVSFSIMLILAVLATGLISFERDIFKVLPQNTLTFKVLVHSLETSSSQEKLYLLIKGPEDHEALIKEGIELVKKLKDLTLNGEPAFQEVSMLKTGALDTEDFEDLLKGFLERPENFLTANDLAELETQLTSGEAVEKELKKSLALFATPGSPTLSRLAITDPLNLRRFMIAKLKNMHHGLTFAPGPYLLSPDRRNLLLIATPTREAGDISNAALLLEKIGEIKKSRAALQIGMTGGYALNAQQEELFRGDLINCLIGSALAIAVLFLVVYRTVVVFSFIILPLGVGLQLALGTMAIMYDRIHILATAFATVVLGLGIDFAVHIYDRYKMERYAGKDIEQAVELSISRTGSAVLAGGLTTLSAFLAITVLGNPLLSQIGWLVALGLLFCLLTILWALPACLVWLERRRPQKHDREIRQLGMKRLGIWVGHHPLSALILSALILVLAVPGISRVRFEGRPSALQPRGLEAVDMREELLKAFGGSQDYVLIAWRSNNMDEFRKLSHSVDLKMGELEKQGSVSSWVSLNSMASLEPISLKGVDSNLIDEAFKKYGLKLNDFTLTRKFIDAVTMGEKEDSNHCAYLKRFPAIFERFYICGKDQIEGITWAMVPGGEETLRVQAEFSRSLPSTVLINPRLAVNELVAEVRSELGITLLFAGGLILIILAAFLRKVSAILLVLLPMALGLGVTVGLMGWAGIHLNPFNFIVLPILMGIGLDDGIHIYRRFMEWRDIAHTLSTTGRSILVTTLTTACGFGSLSLANYHVLESMGLMTIFGVLSCFIFSVIALPPVLAIVYREKHET